jgi:hypothetical protein
MAKRQAIPKLAIKLFKPAGKYFDFCFPAINLVRRTVVRFAPVRTELDVATVGADIQAQTISNFILESSTSVASFIL